MTTSTAATGGSPSRAAAVGAGLLAYLERRLGLTRAGLAVVVLAALGIVVGRLIANTAVVLLAYGFVVLLVIAWVLGRRRLPLDAQRSKLPSRARVGQEIEVTLEVGARRRVSTVILEDQLPAQLGTPTRLPVSHLGRGTSATFAYSFVPCNRGIYSVGSLIAEFSDPFGLTRRRQVIAEPAQVIVHPPLERLTDRITSRAWEDPPIRPPVSKPWPTGFEFYGMREYSHGDDPRRIVWRAVAQHDKYLVRESEQGITDRVFLLLDTDAASHSPGEISETFETATSVTASLAVRHLDDGLSVSVETNSLTLADNLRGKSRRIRMLDSFATIAPEACSFETCLDRLLTQSQSMQHVVTITPRLTRLGAARLRLMIDRGVSLLLVLVLWEDTDPATVHRAGMLGCNVVEVHPRAPLSRVFQNVVGTRRR